MLASQFNLDHRLAELRQAGSNPRVEQARIAADHSSGSTSQGLVGRIRSLVGAPAAGSRPVGMAAR
jgi:hypothetical protein